MRSQSGGLGPASEPPAQGLAKVREAWTTCVHEAGHAIIGVALGYNLAFSDVSEVLASITSHVGQVSSPARTGFTRIFQIGPGHLPAIAFAVAGKAAEAAHELVSGGATGQPFDVGQWRDRDWGKDDDLKDAFTKGIEESGGSAPKGWTRVEREFRRTMSVLDEAQVRAATLEIASRLMRDGRVHAETIHRIAGRWGVSKIL
jgi:hypothetical protein